jgi:hypothetical protein
MKPLVLILLGYVSRLSAFQAIHDGRDQSESVDNRRTSRRTAMKSTTIVFGSPKAEIAICFVGQFLRHAKMSRVVSDVFRTSATSTPGGVAFDAYFSMSTQHTELDRNDRVSGVELCGDLTQKRHFRSCQADLREYDGNYFVNATKHLGFKGKDLYPHRTASFFSTISRCVERVKASSVQYDLLVVTRIDVIDGLETFLDGDHKAVNQKLPKAVRLKLESESERKNFYTRRFEYDLIGWGSLECVDDRIMIGPPARMFPLEHLFTAFLKNRFTGKDDLVPEAELYRFFASSVSPAQARIHERKLYVSVNHFKAQNEKYGYHFSERLQGALDHNDTAVAGTTPPDTPSPPPKFESKGALPADGEQSLPALDSGSIATDDASADLDFFS